MLTGGEYQLSFSFDLNLETFMCIRPHICIPNYLIRNNKS